MSIYDPGFTQEKMVQKLLDEDYVIKDPTNPATMVLESIAVTASASLHEMTRNDARVFPNVAQIKDDLYHHMSNEEEEDMFASPAGHYINILIPVINFKSFGVKDPNGDTTIVIPNETIITVRGIEFIVINDITITLNGVTATVIQNLNRYDFLNINESLIPSKIIHDDEIGDIIFFKVKCQQVTLTTTEHSVDVGIPINKSILLPDNNQYYRSEVFYKKDGVEIPVKISVSNRVIDYNNLTMEVRVEKNIVNYIMSDYYRLEGMVDFDFLTIRMYTTLGRVTEDFINLKPSDVKVRFGDNDNRNYSINLDKLGIIFKPERALDGGVNMRPFNVIRKRVIENTTGSNKIPITEFELKELGKLKGFRLNKTLDSITQRIYFADKVDINYNHNDRVGIDVFSNRATIQPNGVNIINVEDGLIIKSRTMFKKDMGIRPLTNDEMVSFNQMSYLEKVDLVNKGGEFYTPFTYALYRNKNILTADVYDLEDHGVESLALNTNSVHNVDPVGFSNIKLKTTEQGYELSMSISTKQLADDTANTEYNKLKGLLKINDIFIHGTVENKTLIFPINSDFIPKMDSIKVHGVDQSGIPITTFIPLINKTELFIIRKTNYVPTDELNISLRPLIEDTDLIVTRGILEMKMGTKLDYINVNPKENLTNRVLDTYDTDVLDRWTEDVFELFNGNIVEIYTDDNGNEVTRVNRVAKKGDVKYKYLKDSNGNPLIEDGEIQYEKVYDEDGNIVTEMVYIDGVLTTIDKRIPIYKHRAGDVLLDANGNSTVVSHGELEFTLNVIMFNKIFDVTNDPSYKIDYDFIKSLICSWSADVTELNNAVLENTTILVNIIKNNGPITLDGSYIKDAVIKPRVILHTDSNINVKVNVSDIRMSIGNILTYEFGRVIVDKDRVRAKIMKLMPTELLGVTIDIPDTPNLDIYKSIENKNRFVIGKRITNNGNIIHDIDIEVK